MKQVCYLISILSLLSCQKEIDTAELLGSYETIDYSSMLKVYQDINGVRRVIGLSLDLNADSSFVFGDCTSNSYGSWTAGENLNLHIDTTVYKSHFLNSRLCTSVPEHRGRVLTFEIKNNKLIAKSPKENGDVSIFGMEKI